MKAGLCEEVNVVQLLQPLESSLVFGFVLLLLLGLVLIQAKASG